MFSKYWLSFVLVLLGPFTAVFAQPGQRNELALNRRNPAQSTAAVPTTASLNCSTSAGVTSTKAITSSPMITSTSTKTATYSAVTSLSSAWKNTTSSAYNTTSSATNTTTTTNGTICSGNSATDRSQWCEYDLSTNYYDEAPDTGVTKTYTLELTQATVAPDGVDRIALVVNGSIPGPTLEANWGDWVEVTVINQLFESHNGTSLHFHGVRQNWTNQMDGVTSITQCPTAPGSSYTYLWRAANYGTTWYHSHFALQAWEGVFGGIVINGPASANYDEDMGLIFLNDWSHQTCDELYDSAQVNGPPTLDTGLINGTNVWGSDNSSSQTGSRFEVSVTQGKSYRLRLVNGAIDTHFKYMIDNHTMTVMAMDLVPIVPYQTTNLDIAIGQRYDVVVTFDEQATASDFWMRAVPQTGCSDNANPQNIKGIIHYGNSTSTPTTTGYTYVDSCDDELASSLVPYLSLDAASPFYSSTQDINVMFNSQNLFRWYLNEVSFVQEWSNPTLLQVHNNASSFTTASIAVVVPEADQWVYLIIDNDFSEAHPIHLHGHDFWVLSQSNTNYTSSTVLNLDNPPRRDVATLPGSGSMVIAFITDNPGAWLCHCHIGWHTSEGFALQFIERQSEISIDSSVLESNCDGWTTYATADDDVQEDSGV